MYSRLYHMAEASVLLNKLVSHTYIYIHIYTHRYVCIYIYTCIYSYKMAAVAIAIHLIKL